MRQTFFFIILFFVGIANAQKVNNVKLTVEGDKIVVTYDIDDYSTKWLYNVDIVFQSTTRITPFALSGDVGKDITGGKNKKIVWDLYQDIDGLTGNLKAEITVKEGTSLKHRGMASNAFKSLILPGLGDYSVYEYKWHPILMHSAFACGVTMFIIAKGEGNHQYNLYKEARTQQVMDESYSKYKDAVALQKNVFYGLAALYVYDFSFVFVNGLLNKRNHPYYDKQPKRTTSAVYLTPSPYSLDGFQLSYVLKF